MSKAKDVEVRMSDEELKFFEELLKQRRAKLVEELRNIEDSNLFTSQSNHGGELSGYTNHLADAASDYTTLDTNFGLAEREGRYLTYIERALSRIKKGTYGVCNTCKELIPKRRLEAVPTATRCVSCKEEGKKQEALEMQMEMAKQKKK